MKTSILKANEQAANLLFNDFDALNSNLLNGRKFIKKPVKLNKETEEEYLPGSFIIRYVTISDEKKGITIFKFLKTQAGNRIEWDERFCTI